jgi:rhodanese-related sulfurtransferase
MKDNMTKIKLVVLLIALPIMISAQTIKTKQQVLSEIKTEITQISPEQLKIKMDSSKQELVLIDVRTDRERDAGYISGSVWIPSGFLEMKIQDICKNAETEIVVYCRGGGRSMLAAKALQQLGFKNVFSLEGGINAWGSKGYSLYNFLGEIKVVDAGKKDPNLSIFDVFKE